jgi:tRNA A-37 threonylcarbamoyl transferase component Bud32
MTIFEKSIDMNEYNMLKILRKSNIIPKIYNLTLNEVSMKQYDCTLREYLEANEPDNDELIRIYSIVENLIHTLHRHGILHGDLHSDNIVCNERGTKFKLIDFQRSTFIKVLNDESIQDFLDDFNGIFECDCKTADDIVNAERTSIWKDKKPSPVFVS